MCVCALAIPAGQRISLYMNLSYSHEAIWGSQNSGARNYSCQEQSLVRSVFGQDGRAAQK